MTTTQTDQPTIEAAVNSLYADQSFALIATNRWNGTDLHSHDGQTIRFTREDPEGSYWVGILSRNSTLRRSADVSAPVSADTLAAIATALWMDR